MHRCMSSSRGTSSGLWPPPLGPPAPALLGADEGMAWDGTAGVPEGVPPKRPPSEPSEPNDADTSDMVPASRSFAASISGVALAGVTAPGAAGAGVELPLSGCCMSACTQRDANLGIDIKRSARRLSWCPLVVRDPTQRDPHSTRKQKRKAAIYSSSFYCLIDFVCCVKN